MHFASLLALAALASAAPAPPGHIIGISIRGTLGHICGGYALKVACDPGLYCFRDAPAIGKCLRIAQVGQECGGSEALDAPRCAPNAKCVYPETTAESGGQMGTCEEVFAGIGEKCDYDNSDYAKWCGPGLACFQIGGDTAEKKCLVQTWPF